ncbi:Glycosyltransferase [Methanosarcina lacustris Z-7289]|uniref:Glycosyltransferase n=1 Tax=Methanosarcina lacustris Z-7289 TaxID=1434111 RepID=A0A0E3SAJ7_9EURY|nr:glycosyltransferase [Methanosarcina lacustris]AKB76263.1 Glycosyltransferase [Methanosarcina lacustris Z-7289]
MRILYVTEADHSGNNGASINSKGTYMALSSLGQCNLISGSRLLVPEILSSDFSLDYDVCWLRGMFSSFLVENLKKSFMVYDICGILSEEHKLKGNDVLQNKFLYNFQKYCIKKADLVKVHTPKMRKYFEDAGILTDYIQIPPIIDIAQYPYIKKEFNFDNVINVGYSGNSREWQGIPTLLESFNLLQDNSNILLNLIGPSKEEIPANLKNIICLDKCSHNVYISQILPKFDIFVVPRPSNLVTETTTPIKLIEAMASGIPVIASDVGGINEYVQHNKNGYLVEPENPDALANAISKISQNPTLAYKLAKNARITAEETFDYHRVSSQIESELQKFI